MDLLRVIRTERSTRYYVDGRRVGRVAYWDTVRDGEMRGRRLSCHRTTITKSSTGHDVVRHRTCL